MKLVSQIKSLLKLLHVNIIMENKNVGWLIIGISILIILIIFIFNRTLTEFVGSSCTLAHGGDYCPMYDTINQQTYLALSIVGILIIV